MKTIRMDKKRLKKTLITLGVCLLIGWIIFFAVMMLFGKKSFHTASKDVADSLIASFDERAESIREVERYGKMTNEVLIENVASAYTGYDFADTGDYGIYEQSDKLKDLVAESDIQAIHIVSGEGTIYLTTDMEHLMPGSSIVESGLLTEEQFGQLKDTADEMDMKLIMRADLGSGEHDFQEPLTVEDRRGRTEFYAAVSTGKIEDFSKPAPDNYVIMECSGAVEDSFRSMLRDLSTYFTSENPDGYITSFLVNTDTGLIVCGSKNYDSMIGDSASAHGISMTAIRNGDGDKRLTVDGKRILAYTKRYRSPELGNYAVVCRFHPSKTTNVLPILAIMLIIAASAFFILICGLAMEETDIRSVSKKTLGMVVVAAVLTLIAVFYFVSVSSISWAMNYSPKVADSFLEGTQKSAENGEKVTGYYQRRVVSIARSTRSFLERLEDYAVDGGEEKMSYLSLDEDGKARPVPDVFGNPTTSTPNSGILEGLCYMGAYDKVYILDSNGRTIAASGDDWHYDIVSGQHASDDAVMKVLLREDPYYYEMDEDDSGKKTGTVIAVPLNLYISNDKEKKQTVYHDSDEYEKDETGTIERHYGVLLINDTLDNSLVLGNKASIYTNLSAIESAGNILPVLVSAETPHKCLDYHMLKESEISSFGFTEEEYQCDSYRFAYNAGNEVFAALMKPDEQEKPDMMKEDFRLLLIFNKEVLYYGRTLETLLLLVFSVVVYSVGYALVIREKKNHQLEEIAETPQQSMERIEAERKANTNNAGVVVRAEQGIGVRLFRIFVYMAALILIAFTIMCGKVAKGGFFAYMIGKQWPKSFNIFSFSYVLYLLVIIGAVMMLARNLVELIASSLKPAVETIVRLVLSIIQYAGIMILAFYSMQMLGAQTGTVITFGGIITGIIGLGANSLISDIIAGLFIIFEREFRVGDIVTIDGFTGVVRGISLRTTRVQDAVGHVKTFNNSKITNVLNLTENYSTAFATVNVSLDVPVKKVEDLVNTELPKRLAGNQDIIEGPWFSGIMEIKNGFYTISVGARCEQAKQWRIKKELTKHTLELLKENDIKIW